MAFPLDGTGGTAAPSYYATNVSLTGRDNTFYVGDSITLNLSQATPTNYTIYDYFGNQVATGAVTGTSLNIGSFNPGWYRVRYTGGSTDPTYGASYGASSFIVVRSSPNFQVLTTTNPLHGNGAPGQHTTPPDYATRGMLGIPSNRMEMSKAVNTDSTGNDSVAVLALDAPYATQYWSDQAYPYYDPDRNRYNWTAISTRSWDKLDLLNASAGFSLTVYPMPAIGANADKLYITVSTGTSLGFKLTVSYPDALTPVETWDNLADTTHAVSTINGVSSRIWVQAVTAADTPANISATAIGNTFWNGLAYCSSTLYPLGVGYYEGPTNEPGIGDVALPQKTALFAAAIRAGNPDAKVLGPCPVDIISSGWETFLAAGGASTLDYLSFHDYGTFMQYGVIAMSRGQIESFLALRDKYAPGKPLWQTEALSASAVTGGGSTSFGLLQPRTSGGTILKLLLWEQYGLPRERNSYWYDYSIGFWSVPQFQWLGDGTPLPITALQRVLAEETWGKPFAYRLDMGCEALEKMLVGSIYQAHTSTSTPATAVFIAASHIPGAKLTLNVNGTTSALTVVDGLGNASTVTPSAGKVQIAVDDVPTYLRLPAGVTVSVSSFYDGTQDWEATPNPSVSRAATTATLGGVSSPAIADDQWMTAYTGTTNSPGIVYSSIVVPDTAVLLFPSTISVDRVVIFNGPPNQSTSGLTKFTVDTTADGGSTWITQQTVDISSQSVSAQFGTTQNNTGCGYETFASMQHIFPVSFASPVSCNGVRISASATTYGGSPDSQSWHTSSASANEQRVNLQEIMVISGSTPTNSVSAPANSTIPVLTGSGRLGTVLTCSKGSWTHIPTKYAFQWKRDGVNITGATNAHYLVATADMGHSLTCAVTASNLGGSATSTSDALAVPTLRMVA